MDDDEIATEAAMMATAQIMNALKAKCGKPDQFDQVASIVRRAIVETSRLMAEMKAMRYVCPACLRLVTILPGVERVKCPGCSKRLSVTGVGN